MDLAGQTRRLMHAAANDCVFVFQGEIFRTRGGGTAVQFTDVEVLKHSKPQTPRALPRRSIRLANRKPSANSSHSSNSSISDTSSSSCESSVEWTDVETRVSVVLAIDRTLQCITVDKSCSVQSALSIDQEVDNQPSHTHKYHSKHLYCYYYIIIVNSSAFHDIVAVTELMGEGPNSFYTDSLYVHKSTHIVHVLILPVYRSNFSSNKTYCVKLNGVNVTCMELEGVLPYFSRGEVVKGFGRGSKQLGIPTGTRFLGY